ncbi:MAG TPA: hypothetical protein VK039_05295 [Brevibacterium sp.]|nr:hypothetical protein [Brevibacterium sp.]
MVLRSPSTALVCAAAALALVGCSAPETDGRSPSPTASAPSAEASATDAGTGTPGAVESPSGPEVRATSGAVVDGFPSALTPLPDAEVVNSSVQPAADGQPVTASLMMRTTSSEEEVLDFYADALGDADFSPVGEPSSDADVTSQTFHADEANQMLAVSIAPDTEDEDALLVTVGGRVLP